MKPFRKNVALAIDGGGIRGVIITQALTLLEQNLQKPIHEVVRLVAGTSTGSIISTAIAAGLSAQEIHQLYLDLGASIFQRSWRTAFWPLTRYRYSHAPLARALRSNLGDLKLGDFWNASPPTDVVLTTFDLLTNRTCFLKPWKPDYANWPVVKAVLASSSVPTYFPVVSGRYVDGGVGSYANPCYLAAYELLYCLGWNLQETTLISLGTGRDPQAVHPGQPRHFRTWDWLNPLLDAFLASAGDQQVNLVKTFFELLDFRRFQVDLSTSIPMDDPRQIPKLVEYGKTLGEMILSDRLDSAMNVFPAQIGAG
jgi:predicted acylesterase/phospholipase RssA